MKNVFLVHGTMGNPYENWFPWLERELEKHKITCNVPTFPTPENQNYDSWSKLIDYYCSVNVINKETILVGHSCGAVCIIKYIIEKRLKVKAFITVSGYNDFYSGNEFMDKLNTSFYFDFDECKDIDSFVECRISYAGDNDPFIPQEKLKEFSDKISSSYRLIKGAGHVNEAAGYVTFEEILSDILNM